MEHSFNIELATQYDIQQAILINNFDFWLSKNAANNKHFYDGKFWSYNSVKSFKELFPYLTGDQIRRILEKLVSNDILISGNYNNVQYDRTKWYTFSDIFIDRYGAILQFTRIQLANLPNGKGEIAKPIPDNKQDSKPNEDPQTTFEEPVIKIFNWTLKLFPERNLPNTEDKEIKWKDCIRLLIEQDNRDLKEICEVIKFARNDELWSPNFLSLLKIRKKDKEGVMYYDKFLAKMQSDLKRLSKKEETKKPQRNPLIFNGDDGYKWS